MVNQWKITNKKKVVWPDCRHLDYILYLISKSIDCRVPLLLFPSMDPLSFQFCYFVLNIIRSYVLLHLTVIFVFNVMVNYQLNSIQPIGLNGHENRYYIKCILIIIMLTLFPLLHLLK